MEITRREGHYLVTIRGLLDYAVVREAVLALIARPDYAEVNDVWFFDDCVPALHFDDLEMIAQDIEKLYPPDVTRTRTALVAMSGMLDALANLYTARAGSLPVETRVFSDLAEAERWVAEG